MGRSDRGNRERFGADYRGDTYHPGTSYTHDWQGTYPGGTPPATRAALTAVANLAAKTVVISGGPANKRYRITLVYRVNSVATDITKVLDCDVLTTRQQAATQLAALIGNGLTKTISSGSTITIGLGSNTSLDKLTVAVTPI